MLLELPTLTHLMPVMDISLLLYTETTIVPEWFKMFHKLEYLYVGIDLCYV